MASLEETAAAAQEAADTAHQGALAAKAHARALAADAAAIAEQADLERWKQVQVDAGYTPTQDDHGNWIVREGPPPTVHDDQAG